ncbi:MAG: hypothetical protein JKY00_09145 [Roseicyclus sp.]|nr:hypothetical protein [Roseicyclus sp.]
MRVPLILLLLSLSCAGGSFAIDSSTLSLPLAVSLLAAIAAVLLVAKALVRRRKSATRTSRRSRNAGPHVIIDGSNVMHWNGGAPRLATLRDVITLLRKQGYQPGIIFDANAGYKLDDCYLDDRHFAKLLNLPDNRVLVVGKGEPADPTILAAARDMKAKVITNDRFRDWAADFPEVATTGHLVRGAYRQGKLCLDEGALAA